jgi:prevent-host-death family protein
MATINMHEAKTNLSRLVERAISGEEVIIARHGKPVAKLVPYVEELQPRVPGSMAGMVEVPDDFDDPLPPDLLAAFYGVDDIAELDKYFTIPHNRRVEWPASIPPGAYRPDTPTGGARAADNAGEG